MRLASTLKMASASSDPTSVQDGELYFNSSNKTIRMSESGSWFDLINSENLEFSFAKNVNNITNISASYAYLILSSQQNSILLADSASSMTFVVPNNSTENIEIGTTIKVVRSNVGTVEFTGESGVTINIPNSNYLTAQWTAVDLIKLYENEWLLGGEFPDIY